jgi:hypothetical protein
MAMLNTPRGLGSASEQPSAFFRPIGTYPRKLKGGGMAFDWIEYAAAEPLIDNPTNWVCPCGGSIMERVFEEDMKCYECDTLYEVADD